jgi:hypothetical protein
MLLDDIAFIVFDMAPTDQPGLTVTAHGLTVKIHRRLGLPDENSLRLQTQKVLAGPSIHGVIIGIDISREIDFRAIDMEQTVWLADGESSGFGAVDNIIRDGGDFLNKGGGWNQTANRIEAHGKSGKEKAGTRLTVAR